MFLFTMNEFIPTLKSTCCFQRESYYWTSPDFVKSGHLMHLLVTEISTLYDTSFQPVVTDMGFCLAANGGPMADVLRDEAPFKDVFKAAFSEDVNASSTVQKNKDSGEFYGLEFQANLQLPYSQYLDRDSDVDDDYLYMALNSQHNLFSIGERKIRIRPGFRTFVRVGIQASNITNDVRKMDIEDRRCKMAHENEGMELFKLYTKKGCLLECQLKRAAQICQCINWNHPNPVGGVSDTCDTFGAACFQMVMEGQGIANDCTCTPDCEEVTFSYNIQEIPIDAKKLCSDPGCATI